MIDKKLLCILACPICKNSVKEQDDTIVCLHCSKSYPVRDGIPVMLSSQAKNLNSDQHSS